MELGTEFHKAVERYKKTNWDNLLREELGRSGALIEAKESLESIRSVLDKVIEIALSKTIAKEAENLIVRELSNFHALTQRIYSFSDVSERDNKVEEIINNEFSIRRNLLGILMLEKDLFVPNKEKEDVSFDSINSRLDELSNQLNSSNIKDASKIGKALLNERENIELLLANLRDWNNERERAVKFAVETNKLDAVKKTKDHTLFNFSTKKIKVLGLKNFSIPYVYGSFIWLLSSLLFGSITLWILFYFLNKTGDQDMSVGLAIFRVATVLIPSYFAYFSAQQYLNHRKLYEAYSFKQVALNTMLSLQETYRGKSLESREVLVRGLNVLFTEPMIEKNNKYDRDLALALVDYLKKSLK